MEYTLRYGSGCRRFTLPDDVQAEVLAPKRLPLVEDVPSAVCGALDAPLNAPRFEALPCPSGVAIAVPDETRPTPLKELLPPLLRRMRRAWGALAARNISIIVGGGLHPAPNAAQLARILPPEAFAHTVIAHDAAGAEFMSFGTTTRGTPVEINAAFGRAAYKIVIGQIDPHQFAGFTGGAKGVVVGCAGKAMIRCNHSLMADPLARVGAVEDNPVRRDLDEAGERIGIDLAVDVVLDGAKQVVGLFAGRPVDVLAAGCSVAAAVHGLPLADPFDIAVASCGGHPKDMCLYQAQKGLNLASQCLREGGSLLLLAACEQGVGDDVYETYVRGFSTPRQQMREFQEHGFRMGAHKALLFSRTLVRFQIGMVSELDAETLSRCMLRKVPLQETVDLWRRQQTVRRKAAPRIAVIPNANTTYFHTGAS